MKIIWKRDTRGGYKGFCGEIQIFTISLAINRSKNGELPWILRSTLPTLESNFLEETNKNKLMTEAAITLEKWLKRMGFHLIEGDCYST